MDPLGLNDPPPPHEFRLYLDDREHRFVVVDEIDYHYFVQWRYGAKPDKHRRKFYAYRVVSDYASGRKINVSVYLHVEIMQRTGIVAPPGFTMVDHRDGDEGNCRRSNLRWATPSMNRRNINGQAGFDLMEGIDA